LFYRHTPTTYKSAIEIDSVWLTPGIKKYFPAATSDLTLFLPAMEGLSKSNWSITALIGGEYVNTIANKEFALPTELLTSTTTIQNALYHNYVETSNIAFESDVPDGTGIKSTVTKIRLSFSKKTFDFFKITPIPCEDQKSGEVKEHKSYSATLITDFTSMNNVFNIILTPLNLNYEVIYLHRVFALQ
jgi:hypothetical protein